MTVLIWWSDWATFVYVDRTSQQLIYYMYLQQRQVWIFWLTSFSMLACLAISSCFWLRALCWASWVFSCFSFSWIQRKGFIPLETPIIILHHRKDLSVIYVHFMTLFIMDLPSTCNSLELYPGLPLFSLFAHLFFKIHGSIPPSMKYWCSNISLFSILPSLSH